MHLVIANDSMDYNIEISWKYLKKKIKIWICYIAAEMDCLRFKAITSYLTILADFPFIPFDTLTTELIDFICTLTTIMTRVTGTLIDI